MEKYNFRFLKQNYIILINSFKRINLKFFLILILDFLFYFVFIKVGNFILNQIQLRSNNVNLTPDILGLGQQGANQLLTSVRGFFIFLIISGIIFIILMVINFSFFKGYIWSITTNKKFNMNFFKKFFLLNIIWIPGWVIVIFFVSIGIKQETIPIFLITILIISFYFTNILYPLFLKNNKIKMIKEAFKLGITKIHHFIIPYAIIVTLFFVTSRILNLIASKISIHPYTFFVVLFVFVAFLRYYFVEIVNNISN